MIKSTGEIWLEFFASVEARSNPTGEKDQHVKRSALLADKMLEEYDQRIESHRVMDIEAAKSRVKAQSNESYTIVDPEKKWPDDTPFPVLMSQHAKKHNEKNPFEANK